jgi:ribosomal-protein-alanine N-acetyltransferase
MSAVPDELPLRIRRMLQEDVPDVAGLERSVYEFPWSAGIFRDCLLAGYTSVVLEQARKLAGYSIMSVAAGEAHLLNICIAESLRGQGIGGELLHYMIGHARDAGAERLYLEVRPSNTNAIRLYRRSGFEVVGVRRGYYRAHAGKEDAIVLVYRATGSSSRSVAR